MTGVELGSGTGAGFTISGSTPGGGLITPPLASNLSLRFFSWTSTPLPPCAPPWRDSPGRDKSFSGIVQPDHQAQSAPQLLRFLIPAKP